MYPFRINNKYSPILHSALTSLISMKLCANVYKRHNLLRSTVAFLFFDQVHVLLPMFFINFAFVKKCAFKCNIATLTSVYSRGGSGRRNILRRHNYYSFFEH
jgi:hypothetical protein